MFSFNSIHFYSDTAPAQIQMLAPYWTDMWNRGCISYSHLCLSFRYLYFVIRAGARLCISHPAWTCTPAICFSANSWSLCLRNWAGRSCRFANIQAFAPSSISNWAYLASGHWIFLNCFVILDTVSSIISSFCLVSTQDWMAHPLVLLSRGCSDLVQASVFECFRRPILNLFLSIFIANLSFWYFLCNLVYLEPHTSVPRPFSYLRNICMSCCLIFGKSLGTSFATWSSDRFMETQPLRLCTWN